MFSPYSNFPKCTQVSFRVLKKNVLHVSYLLFLQYCPFEFIIYWPEK